MSTLRVFFPIFLCYFVCVRPRKYSRRQLASNKLNPLYLSTRSNSESRSKAIKIDLKEIGHEGFDLVLVTLHRDQMSCDLFNMEMYVQVPQNARNFFITSANINFSNVTLLKEVSYYICYRNVGRSHQPPQTALFSVCTASTTSPALHTGATLRRARSVWGCSQCSLDFSWRTSSRFKLWHFKNNF